MALSPINIKAIDDIKHPSNPEAFQTTSILERIGNTPLIPLRRITKSDGVSSRVQVLVKAEQFNPGGSVKDRPALSMIQDGEARGVLKQGKTILDATSGNTGIGYALVGAAKGYQVKLVMPENVSSERKGILRAYGAELVLTDPLEGIDESIRTAKRMAEAEPDQYFRPDQYNNPANWKAHYRTTGVEIWKQTSCQITHFVAGIGTSGTLMGTGKRLREYNPKINLVEVEPADELAIIEGLKHMETSIVPGIYEATFANKKIKAFPEDSHHMARRLAQEEGLFVGISAGAAVWAALQVAKTIEQGVIVALIPDGGEKYLSILG